MIGSCLMRFTVISGTENGGAHSNHGAATGNGIGKIVRHTHRQNLDEYIIVFFSRYVNSKGLNF